MEYIIIDDGKMLLTLSAEDMAEYGGSRLNAIRRIVNDANLICGDSLHGRLFVQMYESRGGGCEMFVTRLRERRDTMAISRLEERTATEYRGYVLRKVRTIYEFDEMEELLLCCKMLCGSGYGGRSESYADRAGGKYYLVLDGESLYPAETMGEARPYSMLGYIREHCTRMFGDHAASLLGRLSQ